MYKKSQEGNRPLARVKGEKKCGKDNLLFQQLCRLLLVCIPTSTYVYAHACLYTRFDHREARKEAFLLQKKVDRHLFTDAASCSLYLCIST